MMSAAAVVVCALSLLGRDARNMSPIELVDQAPRGTSPYVEAFVRMPHPTIYLVTSSEVFRDAQRADPSSCNGRALRKLASILVHEQWHVRHGGDERGAYQAQISTLLQLGIPADSPLVFGVRRSMMAVLKAQRYQPALTAVARR